MKIEKKKGEEDVELRLKNKKYVYFSEYKVLNPFPVYSYFLLYYLA